MLKKSKLVSLLLLLLIPIFHVSGNAESFGKEIYNNESSGEVDIIENDFIIRRKVLFDSHPIGAYTDAMFKRDWSAPYRNLYTPNTTTIQQVDGRRSLASFYKKDTGWGRGGGLNQWVPLGGQDNVEEIYMTYRIKFESGFDWRLGGKLPGMAFGINKLPKAGDGTNLGDRGSSVRLMWSRNGQVFLYVYHHAMTSDYGDRLGLGDFGNIQPDVWHTITMRIVANDVGRRNGIIQVWIDDSLVATATNVLLRTEISPKTIGEIGIHTFMGGASSDWAPNRDQHMWLNDFHFWQYSDDYLRINPNVARGPNAHPQNHKLYTPLSVDVGNVNDSPSSLKTTVFPSGSGNIKVQKQN